MCHFVTIPKRYAQLVSHAICAENASELAAKGNKVKWGALQDVRELQELLMRDARSVEVQPVQRAQLARAYKELEELELRLKMKPAPKPIDVTVKPRKQQASSGFSESPAQAKPKRAKVQPSPPIVASDTPTDSVPPNNSKS